MDVPAQSISFQNIAARYETGSPGYEIDIYFGNVRNVFDGNPGCQQVNDTYVKGEFRIATFHCAKHARLSFCSN